MRHWMVGLGASVALMASAASAGSVQIVSMVRAEPTVSVHFDFSAGLSPPVRDRAGLLTLREVSTDQLALIQMPRDDDWAVHFPASCQLAAARCPRLILESESVDWLNPGLRPFRYGASVMMMVNELSVGSNVLQKGYSTRGGQFKLQVDGDDGVPSCVVAGAVEGRNQIFVTRANVAIADGAWHRVDCERTGGLLTITVDHVLAGSRHVPAELAVSTDEPLRIGGKNAGPGNDQFHGTLDDIYINIE